MGRSNSIFKGIVNRNDYNDWNNNIEGCKLLFVGYNENDCKTVGFYTEEEAISNMKKENDYIYQEAEFEDGYTEEEKKIELLHYYGYYFNSDDFYHTKWEDDGVYQYAPIDDNVGSLIVVLCI